MKASPARNTPIAYPLRKPSPEKEPSGVQRRELFEEQSRRSCARTIRTTWPICPSLLIYIIIHEKSPLLYHFCQKHYHLCHRPENPHRGPGFLARVVSILAGMVRPNRVIFGIIKTQHLEYTAVDKVTKPVKLVTIRGGLFL